MELFAQEIQDMNKFDTKLFIGKVIREKIDTEFQERFLRV